MAENPKSPPDVSLHIRPSKVARLNEEAEETQEKTEIVGSSSEPPTADVAGSSSEPQTADVGGSSSSPPEQPPMADVVGSTVEVVSKPDGFYLNASIGSFTFKQQANAASLFPVGYDPANFEDFGRGDRVVSVIITADDTVNDYLPFRRPVSHFTHDIKERFYYPYGNKWFVATTFAEDEGAGDVAEPRNFLLTDGWDIIRRDLHLREGDTLMIDELYWPDGRKFFSLSVLKVDGAPDLLHIPPPPRDPNA